jgi:hypothetical protein
LTTAVDFEGILAEVVMGTYQIAEVFRDAMGDDTPAALADQERRICPFRGANCAKGGKADPLGVCSLTDGEKLTVVCPVRFVEAGQVFRDVGRLAFGPGAKVIAAPELQILRVGKTTATGEQAEHRVGKVDYLISRSNESGRNWPLSRSGWRPGWRN